MNCLERYSLHCQPGNATTNSARLGFAARVYLTTHNDPIVWSSDIPLGVGQQFGVLQANEGATFTAVTVKIPQTTHRRHAVSIPHEV